MIEKIIQTAGRDQLGEFAPMFAHLNDDVLFGEVWKLKNPWDVCRKVPPYNWLIDDSVTGIRRSSN